MFSRDYMIPNAKMLPYYFIAEFEGILLGLFSFIRLSQYKLFFFNMASLDLLTSLNHIK